MFAEYFFKKIVDTAVAVCKEQLSDILKTRNESARENKRSEAAKAQRWLHDDDISKIDLEPHEVARGEVSISTSDAYRILRAHVEGIDQWSNTVGFSDLRGVKSLSDIFVQLDTYLTPVKLHLDSSEKVSRLSLEEAIFGFTRHCVILGQPGAGKTTSMKKLCLQLIASSQTEISTVPLLVRFRDIKDTNFRGNIILRELARVLPLQFNLSGKAFSKADDIDGFFQELKEALLLRFVDDLNITIVLDGFDEFPNNDRKAQLAQDLRSLALSLLKSRVIVTCRTGEFPYEIENARTFEIAPLSAEQVHQFANRWLGRGNAEQATDFIQALNQSPFADTAIKPLSLAHLCAIYERIGKIPDRPKTVYRKIVALLLEEWDQQRSVKRPSRYAKFEPDRKFEFLSHLAFVLTAQSKSSVFGREQLLQAYRQISANFGLDSSQAADVVVEIESHTGLFLQSGFDQYEFVHKSLQEYLAAEYIVKLPSIPTARETLSVLGAELAIAVSVSSNPSLYLADLAINILSRTELPPTFYDAFLSRLLLERPDFHVEKVVILGFFCLLTMWINGGRVADPKHDRRDLSEQDELRYSKLLTLISANNALDILFEYYNVDTPLGSNDSIIRIPRKQWLEGFSIPPYLLIPRVFIRQVRRNKN